MISLKKNKSTKHLPITMFKAENYPLTELNAFRFKHSVKHYVECQTHSELTEYVNNTSDKYAGSAPIVFGEGSNTVLTNDINGSVLRYTGKTVTVDSQADDRSVQVTAQAGKNWHELVVEMTAKGFQGIENLSLIPGTCGAAPVQNIGAYGVELSDILISVTALHWPSRTIKVLKKDECQFGYRDSIFKQHPDTFIITEITLRLNTENKLVISYAALKDELQKRQIQSPTSRDISEIVCDIRRSKLPDPLLIPNAGSYFKNPVVSKKTHQQIVKKYSNVPSFPAGPDAIKIAAGWLIESSGLKGYRHASGHVGVHKNQALVLVHDGNGKASDLLDLAEHVQTTIINNFGIELEREPVLR